MENQSIVFPPRLYSICCFSTISLTTTPWLSRQGCIRSGCLHGLPCGYAQSSQISQDSVESVNVSNPCSFKKRATSVVSSSCAALVCSISCIFIRSETSATLEKKTACPNLRILSSHSFRVPTAGGHAQVYPYHSHSCKQTILTLSSTDRSQIFKKRNSKIRSFAIKTSNLSIFSSAAIRVPPF